MSKKQLHNRLENLFTNLAKTENDTDAVSSSELENASSFSDFVHLEGITRHTAEEEQLCGWTWEIDSKALFTYCSPQIVDGLGIPADTFLGQSFLTFGLHPASAAALQAALSAGQFPLEQDVQIQDSKGNWVAVRIHILKRSQNGENEPAGWQGFAQIMSGQAKRAVTPALPAMPAPLSAAPTLPTSSPKNNGNGKASNNGNGKGHTKELIAQRRLTPTENPAAINLDTLQWQSDPHGFATQDGTVFPANQVWTEVGHESLDYHETKIQNASTQDPATIAVPFEMQGMGDMLLEIVDDNQQRHWTEDDRFLVMEVVGQLTLALNNAQLYSSAQQELADRIRAEQAILRRNKDLSTLNRIGQQLSRLATRSDIFDLLADMISEVVGGDQLFISTYHAARKVISFPIYRANGENILHPERPYTETGLPEYVLSSHNPLLITQNTAARLQELHIEIPTRAPLSVLAIPLITGERAIGAVIVQDFEHEGAYDDMHVELLSTAIAQATTAIENADLFEQMQRAMQALESRERYQSNVARAAATLTESGTKSMTEVMRLLGSAAQCSRVYFAQYKEAERDRYWSASTEWIEPSIAYLFDRTQIAHISTNQFLNWAAELREKGWIMVIPDAQPASAESQFLTSQHVRSSLLLAVPGETSVPSFLAFEQVNEARAWQSDEINALRVAADAITNTFVREGLLRQVQASLDETENLYRASNRMAVATDMQEMVEAVLSGVRTPEINRAVLLLFETDPYGKLMDVRVAANWYSGRGTPPPPVDIHLPPARFERFVQTQSASFVDDVQNSALDVDLRAFLLQQNVTSLAVLPLFTGKRQTGALLVESEVKHQFSGRETRTYPPLADQMAITVENQLLFEQTQKALSETELLYNVSNRIAQAISEQDMLELVVESVLPASSDRASLLLIDNDADGNASSSELTGVEMVGFYDLHGEYQAVGDHLLIDSLAIIKSLTDEPLILNDIDTAGIDAASQQTLLQYDIHSALFVPLRTSGRLIGVLVASSSSPAQYTSEEAHLLRITGNGIAVSIEKQRLLRQAQRRALELQTASEIARDTTSTLSLDLLLNRIVNLLSERFNFYHTSIFLVDESGENAVVRESTGEAGKEMKRRNHKLIVGSRSVVGRVTGNGEPYIVNNVLEDTTYLPNPLLPDTRAEMGIPLKISNKVIGALDLQARDVNAFHQDDVHVLQILADQIAIAIENARAYELSQRAFEDMREVDRVKSQFLANMSHELRTPLNSIIGFSRVIIKGIDGPINETQKQDLGAIYNSGQHLLTLINDILDLSKIEAGKMELSFAEINLNDMITSALSTASGLVKDKPVKLQTKIAENLPAVRADQIRVRQVLINFLSNAAKFTDEGSITVEASVVTSPKTHKAEVMLAVTDTGPGIAQSDQVKLFLPFSQVDDSPTRKTGGTGLGLSICRSLIDMHNGRIGLLRSEVGVGSTFFFTLPTVAPTPDPEPEVAVDDEMHTILAIDDDPRVISLYERYLKPHGYQLVAVTSPRQAVQRAKEVHPFAITLDIMMPEKDGWQVMQDLKNDPETRDIPIIVCSILENQEKGFSMGAADYLVKPFMQDDLINAIARLNRDGKINEILVIDDDPADLRLVQKMVEDSQKFRTRLAQGGKQGWESIQQQPPDAIILDLFMPGMNGFELLASLRADEKLRDIPVIVLTGADLTPDQHKQLSDFGQSLLTKGYLRENDLLIMLENALKKYQVAPTKRLNSSNQVG